MFKRANAIVAEDEYDDLPMIVVIDATLTIEVVCNYCRLLYF